MDEERKKRVRDYRARAVALHAKGEALSDDKERAAALRDAEMWDCIAEWEEKTLPCQLDPAQQSEGLASALADLRRA